MNRQLHARAMELGLRKFGSIACVIWSLNLWLMQLRVRGDFSSAQLAAAVGLLAVAATCIAVRRAPAALGPLLCVVSTGTLLLSPPHDQLSIELAVLPAMMGLTACALMPTPRQALAMLAGIVLITAGVVLVTADPGVQWADVWAVFGRGIVTGVVAVWVVAALRQTAAWRDRQADALLRTQLAADADRVRRDARAEADRTLHDTVVNTLGAISLGLQAVDVDALKRRCKSDLDQIRRLLRSEPAESSPLDSVVARCVDRAIDLGLVVRVDNQACGMRLPSAIAAALEGALNESLLNVAKHSGVRDCELNLGVIDAEFIVVVADFGRGFDAADMPGGGLAASVLSRAARAGMHVAIDSKPGQGTTVTFGWRPDASDIWQNPIGHHAEPVVGAESMRRLARNIVGLLAAFMCTQIIAGALSGWSAQQIVVTTFAVAVLTAVAAVTTRIGDVKQAPPGRRLAALIAVGCAVTIITGLSAQTVCDQPLGEWVGAAVGFLLLSLIALLAVRLWVLAVCWIAYLLSVLLLYAVSPSGFAGCDVTRLLDGRSHLVTVVLWIVLRLVMDRQFTRVEFEQRELDDAERRTAAQRLQAEHHQLRVELTMARVRRFYAAILEGGVDPTTAEAVARARQLERLSRSLLALPTLPQPLESAAANWVEFAAMHELVLTILVAEDDVKGWSRPELIALDRTVSELLAATSRGSEVTICGGVFDTEAVAIVVTSDGGKPTIPPTSLKCDTTDFGDQTVIELRPVAAFTASSNS